MTAPITVYDDVDISVTQVRSVADPAMPGGWISTVVVNKPGSVASNGQTLASRAAAALAVNAAFLAVPVPTNVQIVAQVQRLTRQCSALIRLQLGALDDTSGT